MSAKIIIIHHKKLFINKKVSFFSHSLAEKV